MSSVEKNMEMYKFLLIVVGLILLFWLYSCSQRHDKPRPKHLGSMHPSQKQRVEIKNEPHLLEGIDSDADDHESAIGGQINRKDYETLIFDNTTGSIMTGSQFMDNTGIITAPWVAPAWAPDMKGPSASGELNESDFDEDPRMLYNKCSLSCCSPQYPTPFQSDADPFVCDKNGKNKYNASSHTCMNETGSHTGCLCVTKSQIDKHYV